MGVVAAPVFDTQLAAAFLGMRQQIGYGALVERYTGVHLPKADSLTDWSKRPLDLVRLAARLTSPSVAPGRRLFARPWAWAAGLAAALGVAAGAYLLLSPPGRRAAKPALPTVQTEDAAWLGQAFAVPGDAR